MAERGFGKDSAEYSQLFMSGQEARNLRDYAREVREASYAETPEDVAENIASKIVKLQSYQKAISTGQAPTFEERLAFDTVRSASQAASKAGILKEKIRDATITRLLRMGYKPDDLAEVFSEFFGGSQPAAPAPQSPAPTSLMNEVMTELRDWKDRGKDPIKNYFSNVESIQAAQEKVGKPVFNAAVKAFVRDVGVSDETSWNSLTEEDAITEFAGLLNGKSKIAKRYIDAAKKQTITPTAPAAPAAPEPAPVAAAQKMPWEMTRWDYAESAKPNKVPPEFDALDALAKRSNRSLYNPDAITEKLMQEFKANGWVSGTKNFRPPHSPTPVPF